MVVLFLDIDGVLCSYDELRLRDENGIHLFREEAVIALNMLAAYYDARLVLTSTWRGKTGTRDVAETQALFNARGIYAEVLDFTPRSGGTRQHRGTEVNDWLAAHPEVTQYIVIDDETADLEGAVDPQRILKTNRWRCLDMYDARQAVFRFDRVFSKQPVTMWPG
jgi:hypothetical protein